MKHKLIQGKLRLEEAFSFTLPKEICGFRLILLSSDPLPWNLLLYAKEKQLVGQMMSFSDEKELWIGPDLESTSPYCLPLKHHRHFHLYNLPMADYPENFPEMKVEVICYEESTSWKKDFPLALSLSKEDSPLDYWIDPQGHSMELKQFDVRKTPSLHPKARKPRWFCGDLHTHTSYSDGHMSPEENLAFAKSLGLDFFAATDHTVFPLAWPKEEELLVLPSTEITTAQGHWNLHFSKKSPYDGLDLSKEKDLLSLLTHAGSLGNLCLNHSFMNPWEMSYGEFPLFLASSMEILNDPTYPGAALSAEKALKAWSLLWNWGHDLVGVGGSDAHLAAGSAYPQSEEPSRMGDPLTWIKAEGLSAYDLQKGMRKKRVCVSRGGRPVLRFSHHPKHGPYAGQDATGEHIHLPEVELVFELQQAPREDLYHQWIVDGKLHCQVEGLSSRKNFSPKEGHWIRVDLRLPTGELYGTTTPFRIQDSPRKGEFWGDVLKELKPSIKGIIFDKDGTLLKFTDLWMLSTKAYLDKLEMGPKNRRNCELALGLEENHVRENSPLASGTLDQIIACIEPFSAKNPPCREALAQVYAEHLQKYPEEVQARGDLSSLFRSLKEKNMKLAVLTSDDEALAKQAFDLIGITESFDFIGGGDRYEAKPSPQGIYAACQSLGLSPEEILFVGDSLADMHLRKHVGKVLGIPSEVSSKNTLLPWADALIEKIEDVAHYV